MTAKFFGAKALRKHNRQAEERGWNHMDPLALASLHEKLRFPVVQVIPLEPGRVRVMVRLGYADEQIGFLDLLQHDYNRLPSFDLRGITS